MILLNCGVFRYNIGVFLLKIGGWCDGGVFCAPTIMKRENSLKLRGFWGVFVVFKINRDNLSS